MTAPAPGDFTIIICTRDRPRELQRCLRAVARLEAADWRLIVVDNRPAEGGEATRALVEAHRGRYVAAPLPGANRSRNIAARLSETPYLAFLDDDAIPEPSWLREIATEFGDP